MSPSKNIANGILRALLVVTLFFLLVYFLYEIKTILAYLFFAFVLTLIGNPVLDFLKKRLHFKNTLAAVVTLLFFILILSGFLMLFIPLIYSQGQNLSLIDTYVIEKNSLQLINQIAFFLENHHIDSSKLSKEIFAASKLNFDFVGAFLNSLFGTISSLGIGIASVLFICFYFLKDQLLFVEGLKKLIPDSQETKIVHSLHQINLLLTRYFIGLLLQLSLVFILYLIVLFIFEIENAFVIAFICSILNIIPYVGPLIAAVLAALLTLIGNLGTDFQTENLPVTFYVLLGFCIVQIIDNNIFQPIIFSKSMSSHPLEIFLVLLIAGLLFGIVGMVVAVPMFTILKVFGKEFFPENKIILLLTKNL